MESVSCREVEREPMTDEQEKEFWAEYEQYVAENGQPVNQAEISEKAVDQREDEEFWAEFEEFVAKNGEPEDQMEVCGQQQTDDEETEFWAAFDKFVEQNGEPENQIKLSEKVENSKNTVCEEAEKEEEKFSDKCTICLKLPQNLSFPSCWFSGVFSILKRKPFGGRQR